MIARSRPSHPPLRLLGCLLAVVVSSGSPLAAQTDGAAERNLVREKFLKINYVFNRKLYSVAIPEYERFLKEHPDFEDAAFVHYALALCHYNLATRPAKSADGKAAGSDSGPGSIPADTGSSDTTEDRMRAAIEHLKEAVRARDFESRVEATHLLGQCLLQTGDYKNAGAAFRWVLEKEKSGKLEAAATLGLAETLYEEGRYSEAAATYRSLLQTGTSPAADQSRALFYLAMSLYHDGKIETTESTRAGPTLSRTAEALTAFEKLADAAEDPYRDDSRYMAALILAEQGRHKDASERFEQLIRSGSKTYAERALFGLGSSYFQQGKHSGAEKVMARFDTAFPGSDRLDEARLVRARAQLELGRTDLALELLETLKTSDVVGDQASLILARRLSEKKAYEDAVTVARQALESFPESSLREDLELELALCELAGERFGPAAGTLRTFQSHYPGSKASDHATYLLAYALHRDDQPSESLSVCRAFRQKYPESRYLSEVLQLEAENGFRVGEFKAARQTYETYLANATRAKTIDAASAARTRVRIAQAFYQERDYEEALAVLESQPPPAISADAAGDADDVVLLSYHYYVGECAYHLGAYPRAAGELSKFLERIRTTKPTTREALAMQTTDARFKLGHSLQLSRDHEGARKAYGDALESDPETPHREQIYFELGQLEYTEKNFGAASGHLRALVDERPGSTFAPHALFYLGSIAFDAEDYDGATVYFERVVDRHAESAVAADAEYQLAISLLAAGHDERAEAVRQRFHERHPDDPRLGNILLEEAVVASKSGRSEEALAILTRLEADRTATVQRSRVLYEMAWCYRRLDRTDDAARTYEKLLASLETKSGDAGAGSTTYFANAVRLEFAELEFDRERYDRAKVLLTPLASVTDETLEGALYRLCWCHHMLGEGDATVTVFGQFAKTFPESELFPELGLLAAKALLERGRPGPAGDLFKTIASRFPEGKDTDLALVSYGECRLEDSRFKEAKGIFQDALSRFPASDVAYRARFGLGWANENLGLRDEAVKDYTRVIEKTSTATAARAQFQIGQCFVAAKDYSRAIVEFLKVPASYQYEDWNAKALLQVAGCFEALDDRDKAEEYYREVAATFGTREEGKLARERLRKLEID